MSWCITQVKDKSFSKAFCLTLATISAICQAVVTNIRYDGNLFQNYLIRIDQKEIDTFLCLRILVFEAEKRIGVFQLVPCPFVCIFIKGGFDGQFVSIIFICIYTHISINFLYLYSRAKKWVGVRRPSCDDLGPFAVTDDTLIHFPESQNPIDRLHDDVDGDRTLISNGVTDYTYIR